MLLSPTMNIHSTHQTLQLKYQLSIAHENIIQAETNTENAQFDDDEFINIFSTPVQEQEDCTSMSSAEAEYVSLSACCAQVLWLRTQLTDYGFHFDKIPMYCDSKATIDILCNPVQHSRTKAHRYQNHFIKGKEDRFKYLVRQLGMRCLTPDELEVLAIEYA
ncbi:hypothetical protein Tco_0864844 [Tanacetum coccineum]